MDAASDKSLSVLNHVADELSTNDVKQMKFLVAGTDGIIRQRLETASAKDVIRMLKERNRDMSFIAELLGVIGRRDLREKVNAFADTQASCQLPVTKVLMFHIAQSMSEDDRRNVCFYLDIDDNSYDGIELMTLIGTRAPVGSDDELRQTLDKFGLSHLYDRALSTVAVRNVNTSKDKNLGRCDCVPSRPSSVLRTLSFCDETGCKDNCLYRELWSEKFPHRLLPVFSSEHLLNCDDVTTDEGNTAQELLCEGRFGKVYKGQ